MIHSPHSSRLVPMIVATLTAGVALAAGPCLEVDAPGTVQLPDGNRFEARVVQLCLGDPYTPTTSLLEIRIDGVSVGRYLAELRPERTAAASDRPSVTFDRSGPDRPFVLSAVTVTDGRTARSHRLWRTSGGRLARSRPAGSAAPNEHAQPVETVVLTGRWQSTVTSRPASR